VLVHQAVFLKKFNPAVKRILLQCYTVTLVNYLRRLLAAQGAPLGPDGVEVQHFYELRERLTGEKVIHENQDLDYYDIVMEDALSKVVPKMSCCLTQSWWTRGRISPTGCFRW